VLEIRRQGMRATAPLFIPFMGAAIFQREHPNDALHQAEIGIAGPVAGTVAATAAFVLYSATHQPVLLLWAWLGFIVNLFNLIPVGMLDGGWVLAVASKWFQIAGIALLLLAAWLIGAGLFIIVIVVAISIPVIIDRFRNDRLPYYQSVPMSARWVMGLAWLALVAYLGFGAYQIHQLLFATVPVQ
jgi:Zn-dependent protease